MDPMIEIWIMAIQRHNRGEQISVVDAQMLGVMPAPQPAFDTGDRDSAAHADHQEDFDLWAIEPTVNPDRNWNPDL